MELNGAVLWEGVSRIDGKTPIVCIATGLGRSSRNEKTGGMIQTYILLRDTHPMNAVNDGTDVAICGGCVHRKMPTGHRSCYVNIVFGGPRGVWASYKTGGYSTLETPLSELAAGRKVRLGTYGDPAAVPMEIWTQLLASASGRTGYTHQWRSSKFSGFARLIQASCETATDVARAKKRGFKTFRVLPVGAVLPRNAVHCPASAENGKKTTCEECLLCDGTKKDVVIHSHGSGKLNYGRNLKVMQ